MSLTKINLEDRKSRISRIKAKLSTYIHEYNSLIGEDGNKEVKPIIEAFCKAFNVDKDMINLPVRYGNVIMCRHGLCYYLYRVHDWKVRRCLYEIGRLTDVIPPDHTTVLHRINTFKNLLSVDDGIKEAYQTALFYINENKSKCFTSLKYRK